MDESIAQVQKRRAQAVKDATASVRIEGLVTSAASDAILRRYVAGQLSSQQATSETLRLHS